MRFMMLVKASKESEAGVMPDETNLADMATYNERLVKAGVMLAGEGLHPSSKGARVRFSGGKPKVIEGPFPRSEDLVAGYWLIQVKSREEALEWARKVPFVDGEVELRQVFELDEFDDSAALQRHRELDRQLTERK